MLWISRWRSSGVTREVIRKQEEEEERVSVFLLLVMGVDEDSSGPSSKRVGRG